MSIGTENDCRICGAGLVCVSDYVEDGEITHIYSCPNHNREDHKEHSCKPQQ